jgi:hypothetical protein
MYAKYLWLIALGTLAYAGVSSAQGVPPVGPSHCVANCGSGGGSGTGGGGKGGSGGANAGRGIGTAMAIGNFLSGVAKSASDASMTATQSAVTNVRDRVQRRKKPPGDQPKG